MGEDFFSTAWAVAPSLLPFFQATAVYFVIANFVTNKIIFSIFKCLPIVALMWFTANHKKVQVPKASDKKAVSGASGNSDRYARLVLIGIFSSMIGDVCVVYKEDLMAGAILTFGFAHICFAIAFSLPEEAPKSLVKPFNLPFFIMAFSFVITLNYILFPYYDDTLRIGAPIYSALIGTMCWRGFSKISLSKLLQGKEKLHWTLVTRALAGVLFFASDGTLTYNLVVNQDPLADAYTSVMLTYYGAELCYALSVIGSNAVMSKRSAH